MTTTTLTGAPAVTAELFGAIRSGKPGATVGVRNNTLPTDGFWVGGRSWTLVKSAERITPDDVAAYVTAHAAAEFIGMWVDGGRVFLDVTDHFETSGAAHSIASARNEIAVFNISSGQSERTRS
ncbi:hypothetical protein [Streptomyces microflavus]|uniref:hypothetical protein n=1 Tax=Streptomyces microflavus TaxID=1919 RepID=UPI00368D7816